MLLLSLCSHVASTATVVNRDDILDWGDLEKKSQKFWNVSSSEFLWEGNVFYIAQTYRKCTGLSTVLLCSLLCSYAEKGGQVGR